MVRKKNHGRLFLNETVTERVKGDAYNFLGITGKDVQP